MAETTLDERADTFIERVAQENDQIKKFLTENRGKLVEYDIYGLKLQVPGVIPKSIRHELSKIQKKGEVDIEEAEKDTYYLLSIICHGEPYNNALFWEGIDDGTGMAMDMLAEVLEQAYKTENKVKNFRGKR